MGFIRLLFDAPLAFLLLAVLLLYSVIAHEVAHGWCARLFGDETAKRHGRLTLNPLSHLHPVGTLMLFLVGFGWAKPVPVNYANLTPTRLGRFCVALAGCATNILIATLAILVEQGNLARAHPIFSAILPIVARINIMLGAFNLIPIPPLDGSKILTSVLPNGAQRSLARLEPYGFVILILLLYTGWLDPLIALAEHAIYSSIGFLFSLFR
ncbi:MAG: site-2 protease family protein [Candidatus Omnitrophota bacterium]|nr:site-2 protease family protein [Candidatus Omnitrophota bacterium]